MYNIINYNCDGLCYHKFCSSKYTQFQEINLYGLDLLMGFCDKHAEIVENYDDASSTKSAPEKRIDENNLRGSFFAEVQSEVLANAFLYLDGDYSGDLDMDEVKDWFDKTKGKLVEKYTGDPKSVISPYNILNHPGDVKDSTNETAQNIKASNESSDSHTDLIAQFKEKLEDVLDEQFPKRECKERGHALVLYAQAVILFERCFDAYVQDAVSEPEEKE